MNDVINSVYKFNIGNLKQNWYACKFDYFRDTIHKIFWLQKYIELY